MEKILRSENIMGSNSYKSGGGHWWSNVISTRGNVQPFSMINIFIVYINGNEIAFWFWRKTGNDNINTIYTYITSSRPLNDAIIISYIFISIQNEMIPIHFVTYCYELWIIRIKENTAKKNITTKWQLLSRGRFFKKKSNVKFMFRTCL